MLSAILIKFMLAIRFDFGTFEENITVGWIEYEYVGESLCSGRNDMIRTRKTKAKEEDIKAGHGFREGETKNYQQCPKVPNLELEFHYLRIRIFKRRKKKKEIKKEKKHTERHSNRWLPVRCLISVSCRSPSFSLDSSP